MTMIDTPEGIEYFRWAQLKGALKLESVGLKHSSGRSVRAEAKRRLGLKTNDFATLISAIEQKMQVLIERR